MIPQSTLDLTTLETTLETTEMPSKTFAIDFDAGRVRGKNDGLDAIKQSIVMILSTPRYQSLIHSRLYGSELGTLIGAQRDYALSRVRGLITEALTMDDRVFSVSDFAYETDGHSWTVSFTVHTKYGDTAAETEVII